MHGAYRSVWTELLATPFRQGWLDAGGIKTRFVQAGSESNPPLIMLHGTAGSLENFAANIAPHAEHFNCIAFDMIGSGMTAKPDYDYETEHYVKHVLDFYKAANIRKWCWPGVDQGDLVADAVIGLHQVGQPGLHDRRHGIREHLPRVLARGVVTPVFELGAADQVARLWEGRHPSPSRSMVFQPT